MTRWRTYTDRLIVLAVILAAWQVGSAVVGPYWLSSPWAVAARFTAQMLNGELIVHGGYTVEEALIGTRHRRGAGGAAAVPAAAPPDDRRDSRSVHGRRLRRSQARLRAAVHSVVRHRHRIQDRAGGERRVLHRLFHHAVGRARARSAAGADGADRRRGRAPCRAPHRLSRRGAADLRRLSHRGALRHRRRGHRRADLVQSRARLSGADRRDELRHHLGVRRDPRRHPHRPCRQLAAQRRRAGRCCAGGRAPPAVRRSPGPEHERHAAARDQEPRQALSARARAASRRPG